MQRRRALDLGPLVFLLLVGAVCHKSESDPTQSALSAEAKPADKATEVAWLVMKEQADLRTARGIRGWAERGRFVHQRLAAVATASQAGLRARIAARGVRARHFWIVNAVRVEGDKAAIAELARDPAVERVLPDRIYSVPPHPVGSTQSSVLGVEWGVSSVRAPEVWSTFATRGEGVVVANIDTGVQYDHPALARQYRGQIRPGVFDHNYNWFDPANVCPAGTPCDNNNHGTHTMGTMVGDDGDPGANQIGVAPKARWIAAKGCEGSGCSLASLLAAGQWVLAPTDLAGQNPRPDLRPHIVNNSWGGAGGDTFYQATVQAWVAAGIFPAFANGNSGPGCGTAGSPGDYPESYAVGAHDVNNAIASFSSRGASALGGIIKPNIAAPGVNVRSSVPGGGYAVFNGTSMATPHLSGVVALLWSAAPALMGDIDATRALLDQTAIDTSELTCGGTLANNNAFGQGRVDAFAAVDLAPRGPMGTVAGVITAAEAGPVSGATVRLLGPTVRMVQADATGTYSSALPIGVYAVSASAFGYVQQTVASVAVVEGATTTQNFVLQAAPSFVVAGTVRDSEGTPVAGARVTIVGTPLPPVTTGMDGTYAFPSVPVGTYDVGAAVNSRCNAPQSQSLTVDGAETLDFVLPARRDAFGYGCTAIPLAFVDGDTVLSLSGDDASIPVALPFPFAFYGVPYQSVHVSTNGHLSFSGPSSSYSNQTIPSDSVPNGAIYGYWDDLVVDSSSSIRTRVLGSAPARRFAIEWRDVALLSGGARVRFEIVLAENGQVEIHYMTVDGGRGQSATVGLENEQGSVAFQYSSNEAALDSSSAIRFGRVRPADVTPPAVELTAPTAGSTVSGQVALSANASDGLGIALVEFILDVGTPQETRIGTDATAPYQAVWNSVAAALGPHTLSARGYDLADNAALSAPVTVNVFNDVTPPMVQITAPVGGATVSGTALVTATATDDGTVARVELLVDGTVAGTDTAAPFEWQWDTQSVGNGAHTLSVRAVDSQGNLATTAPITVTVDNPGAATYDPVLRVLKCDDAGPVCDTRNQVNGRAQLGPEPNQPNTLGASCPDGTSGSFHSDESLDRLRIETLDATPLAPGKAVRISATVWVYGASSDSLDLYHAPDAQNPVWTSLGTFQATGNGQQTIVADVTLPMGGAVVQAIRGQWRYSSGGSACQSGGYNDRDDLAFAVEGAPSDTTPPTAAVTTPAPGGLLRGTVAVAATATDGSGVTGVDLLVDGVVVASDGTAPYAFSWDTTTVADGVHALAVRATDGAGNVGTSAPVSVTVDNTAPAVAVSSPMSGSVAGRVVAVSASASDNNGIASTDLLVDGVLVSSDASAPYSFLWTAMSEGSHALVVRARDVLGNVGTSSTVLVTVDFTAPTVVVTAPAPGGFVRAPVVVAATVSDSSGITSAELLVDGLVVASDDAAPYSFSWPAASEGSHSLLVRATDAARNVGASETVSVTMDNLPPAVAITSPTNRSVLGGPVVVTATANDSSGIASAELLVDGVVVATDDTAPYAFSWDTLTAGADPVFGDFLVVRATDRAGNVGTSNSVNVFLDRRPPAVSISAPRYGETVSGSITVMVDANDFSPASGVSEVRFLLDGVPQVTVTTSPFSWRWDATTASSGPHTLGAIARDWAGNEATATPISVMVAGNIWLEAESASITSPMQVANDVNASGGRYIQAQPGQNSTGQFPAGGRATYSFTVAAAGTYYVWGRVIAPSSSDDSFWVAMDGGAAANWNGIAQGTAWHWDRVYNAATTGVVQYSLAAGTHTLVVAYREDGAKLDRLLLTSDYYFVPTGLGPPTAPATPTGVGATPGDGQATVSWTGSAGANTYNLKRGPNAGPYTTIATGITGTSQIDAGLVNGTQYCYVVTAVNSVGESGPSPQACATPSVATVVWIQAESGVRTAPMQVGNDTAASGGQYIQAASGNSSTGAAPAMGWASFTVNAARSGAHKIWGRVIAPSTAGDSFWIRVNGGAWVKWNKIPLGSSWHWDDVHQDGASSAFQFNLNLGANTIDVAYREQPTKLDRLLVTSDQAFVPTGMGP